MSIAEQQKLSWLVMFCSKAVTQVSTKGVTHQKYLISHVQILMNFLLFLVKYNRYIHIKKE